LIGGDGFGVDVLFVGFEFFGGHLDAGGGPGVGDFHRLLGLGDADDIAGFVAEGIADAGHDGGEVFGAHADALRGHAGGIAPCLAGAVGSVEAVDHDHGHAFGGAGGPCRTGQGRVVRAVALAVGLVADIYTYADKK